MKCRHEPCETCPYRKDVPSGVWAEQEYTKLIEYDQPTFAQPPSAFFCHTNPNELCNGWAVVHVLDAKRGHEAIGLRILTLFEGPLVGGIPRSNIPLFASGTEAAEHGMREIDTPGVGARRAVAKLDARRKRARRKV